LLQELLAQLGLLGFGLRGCEPRFFGVNLGGRFLLRGQLRCLGGLLSRLRRGCFRLLLLNDSRGASSLCVRFVARRIRTFSWGSRRCGGTASFGFFSFSTFPVSCA
jgi:hypothetical protein